MPELTRTQEQIERNFTYYPPSPEQIERFQGIRAMAKAFAALVDVNAPDSREKSLALTKIEEAVMWANAAIARGEVSVPPFKSEELPPSEKVRHQ